MPDFRDAREIVEEVDGEWDPTRDPWTVPVLSWRDPKTIPRRVFLYGHCYARGFVSVTIADGGVGKSLLKIVECLACATVRPYTTLFRSGKPLAAAQTCDRARMDTGRSQRTGEKCQTSVTRERLLRKSTASGIPRATRGRFQCSPGGTRKRFLGVSFYMATAMRAASCPSPSPMVASARACSRSSNVWRARPSVPTRRSSDLGNRLQRLKPAIARAWTPDEVKELVRNARLP